MTLPMTLPEITVALFAACNSLRIGAYFPQMLKAATDKNGASSISLTTWFLFLVSNLSTAAYALVNRSDWALAACFACNALCSAAILVITIANAAATPGAGTIRQGRSPPPSRITSGYRPPYIGKSRRAGISTGHSAIMAACALSTPPQASLSANPVPPALSFLRFSACSPHFGLSSYFSGIARHQMFSCLAPLLFQLRFSLPY